VPLRRGFESTATVSMPVTNCFAEGAGCWLGSLPLRSARQGRPVAARSSTDQQLGPTAPPADGCQAALNELISEKAEGRWVESGCSSIVSSIGLSWIEARAVESPAGSG
jgi:hypothetical protein